MTNDEGGGQLPPFLSDPVGVFRRRWPWIIGALIAGTVSTGIAVFLMPVTYLASATLLVSNQQIPQNFVPTTVDETPFARVDALVGEIVSRERLGPLIEKHNLYAKLRDDAAMTDLVEIARSNVIVAPITDISQQRSSRAAEASVYSISFRDQSAKAAADMANDLATLFTAAASRVRGQQTQLATEFMRAELERSERELREQERLVAEFKERYRGELPAELATNTSKLDRLAVQGQTLAVQLSAAETRLAELENTGDLANPSSPYSRLSALRAKLMEELAANTEEHPNVIALRRQVEALEAEITGGSAPNEDPTQAVGLRAGRSEVAEIKSQIARVAAETARLEEHVARTPQREEEASALNQKVSVLQETYVANLRKLQAAQLSQSVESAQQGARIEVLDRAVPPSVPERTPLKYLFAGMFASLAAAAVLGAALEILDPIIVSAQQLEDELGLRVLGSIGRIG